MHKHEIIVNERGVLLRLEIKEALFNLSDVERLYQALRQIQAQMVTIDELRTKGTGAFKKVEL